MDFRLFIVRHADAGDRNTYRKTGKPDSTRPLTAKGRTQAKAVGKALLAFDARKAIIFSSPYLRTMQTAEIIAAELKSKTGAMALEEMKPWLPTKTLVRWLVNNCADSGRDVVLVGHEPALGYLLGYLLTTKGPSSFDIKKGTLIQLCVQIRNKKTKVQLQCYLRPSELKKLKRK